MNTWKLAEKLRKTADALDEWKPPPRQDVRLNIVLPE